MKQNQTLRTQLGRSAVIPSLFHGNDKDFELEPIRKTSLPCCALAFISLKDYHTTEEIQEFIDFQQKQSDSRKWLGTDSSRGQRNLMVVVSPGENNLILNLQKLGFFCVSEGKLKRRQGYPPGTLSLWLKYLD